MVLHREEVEGEQDILKYIYYDKLYLLTQSIGKVFGDRANSNQLCLGLMGKIS